MKLSYTLSFVRWSVIAALVFAAKIGPRESEARAEDLAKGEAIYQQLCVSCHGAMGEGTKDHPRILAGDKSIVELAKLIDETMPEDEPEKCVGEEARLVAAFMYEKFYSPVAQARLNPPLVEVSRLTVRQYRNSLADLIGGFRPTVSPGTERGLRGEYFKSRRFRGGGDRVIERVDPLVKFDFGEAAPQADGFDPAEFGIRWQGSVFVRDTGMYDFIVRTENAARLWLNDLNRPLIDAWVKSGDGMEHRESVWLLGGRAYPLRLEFFKSKEGKEKRASVALEWQPPLGAVEPIPQRCLTPVVLPETFVVRTPFPPDDRSTGYERGNSVSKEWDQATTDAALETAAYVSDRLREFGGDDSDPAARAERLKQFCGKFVERAFRRPLTDDVRQRFIEQQFAAAPDPAAAVKRVVLLTLKSPRFLYSEAGGERDAYDTASRLSFGLWDSLPDLALLQAAAEGRLANSADVAREAERMLADPRAAAKLREFFLQWLKVDQLPDIAKDSAKFPDFTPAVAADLRTSLDLFVEDIVQSESSDFRQLLLADAAFFNGRLAKFYGIDLPEDAAFQKVTFQPEERAGVLTQPFLLAGFAYSASSSPIHRGVFLARSVLGRSLRPPPIAVAPLPVDLHPDLTTRERVAEQTKPDACRACHALINPLGFSLEKFDAVGRLRLEELGKPVDASGGYVTRQGEPMEFSGARELANFLANSPEVHAAFVQQLFQYMVKQPPRAFGATAPEELCERFEKENFHIRKVVVEIMVTAAGLERPAN